MYRLPHDEVVRQEPVVSDSVGKWSKGMWEREARAAGQMFRGHAYALRATDTFPSPGRHDTVSAHARAADSRAEIWQLVQPDGLALLCHERELLEVFVASDSAAAAEALLAELQQRFGVPRPPAPDQDPALVRMAFPRLGFGGLSEAHLVRCPAWTDIAGNYHASTQDALKTLMSGAPHPDGGRLILWHGSPGTGKTMALRALARSWQDWCTAQVIVDPGEFFSLSAERMLDALTTMQRDERPAQLIVIEDAMELITADARREAGLALSRLLNLTDGILAEGLDPYVLITTNEPITALHPAVQRAGRCLAQIEFRDLEPSEAETWLGDQGVEQVEPIDHPQALADLYAQLRPTPITAHAA